MSIIKNYLLFNHTYLRQLQEDSSIDDQAAEMAGGVRDWYEVRDTSSTQTLIASWIEPMLSLLELGLQPRSPTSQHSGAPIPHLLYTAYDPDTPVGLCYVTPPGANLDSTTKGSHWMAQAVLAAKNWTDLSGEEDQIEVVSLRWVILTNGDQWRLLDAQSLRRYEAYLQVDLGEMAHDQSDLTALRVFYRCFHRTAFVSGANNKSGLDNLLNDSNRATERAERHLKEKMEEVLGNLCRGFVAADRSRGKTSYTDTERDTIFADATYLLYRILFILYAESRHLLPVEQAGYQQVGMQALAEQARSYKLNGIPDLNATGLWDQLKYLSEAIYGAEQEPENELGIPAYNGDLFNNAEHPYLAEAAITDQYLTDAIVDLAFLPEGKAYRLLDYRDLSVRHLGSLYEGMLEYKLFVAEQPMLARRDDKGNVTYLRRNEGATPKKTDQLIEPGEIYFSQSPGERRASGSYYTPEYIVDYIVKQTVWAGLSERRQPLEAKLVQWQNELGGALDEAERSRLQRAIDHELLSFVEQQVLTFRVCDPAMGSGHFLVNATLTIANFIVETLNLGGWPNSELNCSPAVWRRRLVESCIYGVDLNPLAVELAKLSLWLVTMTYGKPLSFLNHHLRHGNSLIGTRLEELADILEFRRPSQRLQHEQAAGQLLLDHPAFSQRINVAADLVKRISTQVAETIADIKVQAGDYEQMRAELAPYRQFANILTARHFGLIANERQLKEVARHLTKDLLNSFPAFQRLIDEVQQFAGKYCFFHWELEFPEVFYEQKESLLDTRSTGFDVIIGNPPYDVLAEKEREEHLEPLVSYFKNQPDMQAALGRKLDLYRLFVAKSLRLLKTSAYLGFIVPMSILSDLQTLPIRRYILEEHGFVRINAFPQKDDPNRRIFPGAKLPTNIIVVQRAPHETQPFSVFVHPGNTIEEIAGFYTATAAEIKAFNADTLAIPLLTSNSAFDFVVRLSSMEKFETVGEKLQTYQGEINETTMRNLLSQKQSTGPKVLRGGNVQRYEFTENARQGVDKYLDVEKYKRAAGGDRAEHTQCYRIGYQRNAALNNWRRLIFAPLPVPSYCFDSISYYTVGSERNWGHFLLALLNSELLNWRFSLTSTNNHVNVSDVAKLPLRRIDFNTPVEKRLQLLNEGNNLYTFSLENADQKNLLHFVENNLRHEPEQSDVVHDLLAYLAEQMVELNKKRQRLEKEFDLFRFVDMSVQCSQLVDSILEQGNVFYQSEHPSAVHHDIEALRLTQEEDDRWLLEVQAKIRDPSTGWREFQRDGAGDLVRRWLPVYRLTLADEVAQFYRYAFANLDGFSGAGKFPGGFTRSLLQKLHATKIPKYVPVDLSSLIAAEEELAETRRKIELTDHLIDQIVYRLYGLTQEEIAIVEGRA